MNTTWVEVKILSAVQMCDFRIFTVIYLPLREFLGTNIMTSSHLVFSSVGRALHRYDRGHGLKSRTGLNYFFRPYFHYCLSSVHYCDDRFHIHVFIRSLNMWLSYIHSRLCKSILYTKEREYNVTDHYFVNNWEHFSNFSSPLLRNSQRPGHEMDVSNTAVYILSSLFYHRSLL